MSNVHFLKQKRIVLPGAAAGDPSAAVERRSPAAAAETPRSSAATTSTSTKHETNHRSAIPAVCWNVNQQTHSPDHDGMTKKNRRRNVDDVRDSGEAVTSATGLLFAGRDLSPVDTGVALRYKKNKKQNKRRSKPGQRLLTPVVTAASAVADLPDPVHLRSVDETAASIFFLLSTLIDCIDFATFRPFCFSPLGSAALIFAVFRPVSCLATFFGAF